MRAALRMAIIGTTVAVMACDGSRVSAPIAGGAGASTGAPNAGHSVVGTWRRTIYLLDEAGAHSSETTWRFNANGTATRLTITRNHTAGIGDAQSVDARWEPLAQAVRVTFLPPSSGTFDFSVRLEGTTLYLASQAYNRVAP